jgi:hypothetical protein
MANKSLCFTCYRRIDRERKREESPVDVNSPAVRREQAKQLKAYTTLLKTLGDLHVNEADLFAILRVLDPYLLPIAKFIKMVDEEGTRKRQGAAVRGRLGVVNSEQDD